MSGSDRCVEELRAFGEMLSSYPIQAEIRAFQMGVVDGDCMIMVYLKPGRLTEGAVGLVEWRRTLSNVVGIAERSPDGDTVKIAVTGQGTENETRVAAWVCHIPYKDLSCIEVEPGASEPFDTDLLDLWAIDL